MLLKYCLILVVIGKIVGISYNRPKFCSYPNWYEDGITYKNSTQGSYPMTIFISSDDDIYTIDTTPELADIQLNGEDYLQFNSNYRYDSGLSYSMFITDDQSLYLTSIGEIVKWTNKTNTWQHVVYINGYCYQIFIDTNDTLYCSMFYENKVVKIDLNDTENRTVLVAGDVNGQRGRTSSMLNNPCGIFVDLDFNLYVADSSNHRIQLLRSGELNGKTVAGERSSSSTIWISDPTSVILDADSYLYIVDQNNHRIVQVTPSTIRCLVGCDGRGSSSNQLSRPYSLSFDTYGNLYVVDPENQRIQKFIKSNTCGMLI